MFYLDLYSCSHMNGCNNLVTSLLCPVPQVFVGNIDNDSTKTNLFDPPIVAQFIRVIPVVCRKACTLRMELVGCELNGKQTPLHGKIEWKDD